MVRSLPCPVINTKETWLNWSIDSGANVDAYFEDGVWSGFWAQRLGSLFPWAIFLIKIFNFHLFCLHFHQLEEFWKLNGAVAVNINLHFMMTFLMLGFRLLDWSSGSFQAVLAIQKQMWRYTVTFINHQLTKIRHQKSIKSIAIVTWPQESCLGVRPLLDFVPSPSSPPVVPCGRWLHSYPREIITFQPTDNKNINHCKLCSTCHVNSPHHPHNPSSSSWKWIC